jgi:hypothetical protein
MLLEWDGGDKSLFDGKRYIESCALLMGASVRHTHKSSYAAVTDTQT